MLRKILIFISVIMIIVSCGPSPKQAADYNTKLSAYHNQVVEQLNLLEETFKSFDTLKIKTELEKTKLLTAKNYKKVMKIGPLRGDSLLYRADSVYYRRCFEILSTEYLQMYKLYKMPDEEYGNEGEFKFKKLQFEKDRKFTQAYEQYLNAQEEFARKYNLYLVEHE